MSGWLETFHKNQGAAQGAKLSAQQARWNASPEEKRAAQNEKNESWKARNLPRLQKACASKIARAQAATEKVRAYKDGKKEVVEETAVEEVKVSKEVQFLVPAGSHFVGDMYRGKVVSAVSKAFRAHEDDESGQDVGGSDYVQYINVR